MYVCTRTIVHPFAVTAMNLVSVVHSTKKVIKSSHRQEKCTKYQELPSCFCTCSERGHAAWRRPILLLAVTRRYGWRLNVRHPRRRGQATNEAPFQIWNLLTVSTIYVLQICHCTFTGIVRHHAMSPPD